MLRMALLELSNSSRYANQSINLYCRLNYHTLGGRGSKPKVLKISHFFFFFYFEGFHYTTFPSDWFHLTLRNSISVNVLETISTMTSMTKSLAERESILFA